MHKEVAIDYNQIGSDNPLRLALAAPDGYGKTTMTTFALVLWTLAYERCRCIAIGSHTRSAAGELLRDVDQELRNNKMLHADFPHLATLSRGSGSSGSRASPPRDIYVRNVARLTTFGSTSSLAEITFEGSPPDLIILDGYEANPEHSEKLKVFDGTGTRLEKQIHRRMLTRFPNASVIVIGTLTHSDSLIDRLHDPDNVAVWAQRFYQAVESYPTSFDLWFTWARLRTIDPMKAQSFLDEQRIHLLDGAKVLWPDHESFEQMMALRSLHGWVWFDRYRQGSPPFGCLRNSQSQVYSRDPRQPYVIDNAGYRRNLSQIPRDIGDVVYELLCEEEYPPQGRPVPTLDEQKTDEKLKF